MRSLDESRDELSPGDVHVWTIENAAADQRALKRAEALLSVDERERHARFVFEKHRRQYALAHALVRTTLSRYAPLAPSAWRFRAGSHGKPEIEASAERAPLRFNLSHCDGLAACAVTRSWDLGVDVEDLEREGPDLEFARTSFAKAEVAHLEGLPPAGRRDALLSLWTLKEAYVKARGLGLSLPLHDFAFTLEPLPAVSFDDSQGEDPASWYFERRRLSAHVLALAVRRPSGAEVRVTYREARI